MKIEKVVDGKKIVMEKGQVVKEVGTKFLAIGLSFGNFYLGMDGHLYRHRYKNSPWRVDERYNLYTFDLNGDELDED